MIQKILPGLTEEEQRRFGRLNAIMIMLDNRIDMLTRDELTELQSYIGKTIVAQSVLTPEELEELYPRKYHPDIRD